ncbi:MAG: flagellar type III secretion system pore protein FliP [Pseudomonadota bacterium]|jgi:flagellar biosynthetic protein FliP
MRSSGVQRRFTFQAMAALAATAFSVLYIGEAFAQQIPLPDLSISVGGNELAGKGEVSSSLKILVLLTLLTFAPAMVLCMTCFTRIAVVLGMTRTAIGTATLPPNTVITGLALFLTVAIMGPVFQECYQQGVRPYMEGQMDQSQAIEKATAPLKAFLVRHAREKDLALFLQITRSEFPKDPADVPFFVAVPGFILSELNTAFQIGFLIALPFLVLDMVVSSVLTSMSMITLPPVVISLPLKLMLFVIVDGWHLIISSLVKTYKV